MSRRHIRDLDQELAASEIQTEFGSHDILPPHQRKYYDVSMFQDDDADLEFSSVEPLPRSLNFTSQYSGRQLSHFSDRYTREDNIRLHGSQPVVQSRGGIPYQSPFFPSTKTAAYSRQQPRENPRPPSRLTLGPGSPSIITSTPLDPTIFGSGSRAVPVSNQSSFYDRFKYTSDAGEPKTPIRLAPKQYQQSSSPDQYDTVSSPSVMPPPRRVQATRDHNGTPPSPHRPTQRRNPLKALLDKHTRHQNNLMEIDQAPASSPHITIESPRQSLSLSHAPLMAQGIQLIPIETLPAKYHSVFPYSVFNATQSKCFNAVFNTSENLVLSSPTGSGKTAVMELAICRLMEMFEPGTFKIIYQAPTKALCTERKRDWEKKFTTLGLKCTELTGDTQFSQLAEVKNGDLIVTTPEKWDSVTRRWSDHRKLLGLVRLFLIDEVHILKEDRGATLEVVVSRMKTIGSRVRFVALSATVPNSKDIATWLGSDSDHPHNPAHEERLGEEYRPVKLEKVVYGYQANSNDFVFDKILDQKIYEVIQKHSQRKPVMVFCATRNICVSTAKLLAEKWSAGGRERPWPAPLANFSFRDRDLQATGKSGVTFHHAGLDAMDRSLIERLFLEGHISIICCTSTLAVGVNLPTHLVVIKNTVSWQGCQMREYLDLEVMQMLGRAGRPQFDTTGVAVIMTRKEKKDRYEKMISGTEKLESCLHLNLIEHLNAEIGLGTITDIESAKQWLRSTFLYIRMKSNPAYYKLRAQDIETELENLIERDIDTLEGTGFIECRQSKLKCLEPGDAMARYYVKFETMKIIMELREKAKCSDILTCVSQADEFKEFRIRSGEKSVLKEINSSSGMKWPVRGDINCAAHKANILIQFEIGRMDFPTTEGLQKHRATLLQDKSLIFQHLYRLIRCICDIKLFHRDSISCRNALELAKCIEAKVWENSPSMLLQLEGVGAVGVRKFVNNDIRTIAQLEELETHKIEMILSRNPPFGAKLKQDISGIPRFRLYTQVSKVHANRRDPVKVNFRVEIGVLNDQAPGKWHGKLLHLYFLVERSDGYLIDFRRMPILKLSSNKDVIVQAELTEPGQTITCHIGCEEIVNTSKSVEVELDIQESQFPRPKKEGPMIAFLRKRANMSAQILDEGPVDLIRSQCSLVNKPFKPLTRDNSKITEISDTDEFGDKEFEQDLKELGDIDGELLMDQPSVPTQGLTWTPINKHKKGLINHGFPKHHGTEDDMIPPPSYEDDDAEEAPEPTQRDDGKWDCNHRCSDKTSCRHLCCREGLDHKPKPKRKLTIKDNTRKLESSQAALPTNDGYSKVKPQQNKTLREFHQSKPAKTAPRKRVSDLINAAADSIVEVIDLSKEDEGCFKGNGVESIRKLNELHSKSRTNKSSIKLPKLSKPTSSYKTAEQPDIPKSNTGELEQLLADDDDDFPSISGIIEEARMKEESDKKNKEKEDEYGLDDSFLDSLDAYVVDDLDKSALANKEAAIYNTPQNTPPRGNMNIKRKIPKTENSEPHIEKQENQSNIKQLQCEGMVNTQEISSETLPSSPPDKTFNHEKSVSSIPPRPFKKVRFEDTVLEDISAKPPPKQNTQLKSSEEPSSWGLGDNNDKHASRETVDTLDASIDLKPQTEDEKENTVEQELMDFLGDCVVFVD
ncbi:Sec63 [Orbilia ellipsospora]|uniref:DNA 3'-5' helicase n=1 Tax=Orbilia ellipsospora TaxID=2528407 RepID=A0AAV9X7K4_9PEZI